MAERIYTCGCVRTDDDRPECSHAHGISTVLRDSSVCLVCCLRFLRPLGCRSLRSFRSPVPFSRPKRAEGLAAAADPGKGPYPCAVSGICLPCLALSGAPCGFGSRSRAGMCVRVRPLRLVYRLCAILYQYPCCRCVLSSSSCQRAAALCVREASPAIACIFLCAALARSLSLPLFYSATANGAQRFLLCCSSSALVGSFVRSLVLLLFLAPARALSHSERTRAAARAPFSLSLAVRVRSFVYASLWQRFLEVLNAHRQVLPRRRSNDTHVLYARCKRETTGCVRFLHSSARFAYQARARFPMGDSFAIFAVLL